MTTGESEQILKHALKLLAAREYSEAQLAAKLRNQFGSAPEDVLQLLKTKRYLDDRRYAENYAKRRASRGPMLLREELLNRGIPTEIVDDTLSQIEWPSLQTALKAKMVVWKMRAPLQLSDSARLFRAMARLGYEEDAIREEITKLHEQ